LPEKNTLSFNNLPVNFRVLGIGFSFIYNLIFHSLIEFSGVFLNEKPDFDILVQPESELFVYKIIASNADLRILNN